VDVIIIFYIEIDSASLPFVLKESPIESFRPIKVRVIGAGYSGIYLGIRIPQRIRNVELKIYDKNSGIGGTWFENSENHLKFARMIIMVANQAIRISWVCL
jgi:hypothetical protein